MEHDDPINHPYLTYDWKKTRHMLTERFVYFSNRLHLRKQIEQAKKGDQEQENNLSNLVRDITNQTMTHLLETQKMRDRQRKIWDAAMWVYPDYRVLVKVMMTDRALRGLKEGVKFEQALRKLLHSYLNYLCYKARRFSDNDLHVWPKLLRLSTAIVQEYEDKCRVKPPYGYRCSVEHHREIHNVLQRDDKLRDNKRIGTMSIEKIGEYFYRFCHECIDVVSLNDFNQILSYEDRYDDVEIDLPPSIKGKALAAVRKLRDYLEEPKRTVIYAEFFGKRGDLRTIRQTLGEEKFKEVRDEALRDLGEWLGKSERKR
jgi:hypothetical protein